MRASRYLSRQELYQLVWAEPITIVAKRFGISDVGLGKACRRALVPVPERGYWAKLKAGKQVVKYALPPRGLGMSDQTGVLIDPSFDATAAGLTGDPFSAPPVFSEDLAAVTERVRGMVGKVSVSKTLAKPHPLIARLLEEDERRREAQRSTPYPSAWNKPLFDSPIERRRLRILNTIFLTLARCDMKSSVEGQDAKKYQAQIGSQYVSFVLEPLTARTRRPRPEDGKKALPERLQLRIQAWNRESSAWKSWEDSDSATMETQLEDIIVNLIVAGEAKYRDLLKDHYEWIQKWKAQEEEEARRKKVEEERRERERLIKEQQDRIDRLLGEATALRQAADIRSYVETVLARSLPACEPQAQESIRQWAAWALEEADRIDPIKSGRFLMERQSKCEADLLQTRETNRVYHRI